MSTLEEELKAMEAELAKMGEEPVEEPIEEEKPVAEEEPAEEPKEEPKVEDTKEPEEPLDNAGYARLRRERQAAERRAEELERQLEAERAKKAETTDTEETVALPPELLSIVERDQIERATRDFQVLEEKFRAKNPEYDDIAQQYTSALAYSLKVQNPRLSNTEIMERAKVEILKRAGAYLRDGFDPIEEMFHDAKEMGFKPRAKEESVEEKPLKPDMKKVAENRAKSPGTAAAGGGDAKGNMTMKYAVENLTLADFSKMSDAEIAQMMRAG